MLAGSIFGASSSDAVRAGEANRLELLQMRRERGMELAPLSSRKLLPKAAAGAASAAPLHLLKPVVSGKTTAAACAAVVGRPVEPQPQNATATRSTSAGMQPISSACVAQSTEPHVAAASPASALVEYSDSESSDGLAANDV